MSTKQKIKVSVIIPTYNRCRSLKFTLESLADLDFPRREFEVVVVDNNSKDNTLSVVRQFSKKNSAVRYVKELRLSLTLARHTGAKIAKGEILSYIDDDVVVDKKWLSAVIDVFKQNKKVGIVSGPILPKFETKPPDWIKKYYPMSSWLSLLDEGKEEHETSYAFGPNFSIRKKVLNLVGGFPADTIGIEAENRPGVVEKIYVGSGDVGLCNKVEKAGYRIIYAPKALVHHVIPPVRLTKKWWHSRLAGEGCCHALTKQYENEKKCLKLFMQSLYSRQMALIMLVKFLISALKRTGKERYEFSVSYHLSRAKVEFALARHPNLAKRLWNIALTGMLPQDIKKLVLLLP